MYRLEKKWVNACSAGVKGRKVIFLMVSGICAVWNQINIKLGIYTAKICLDGLDLYTFQNQKLDCADIISRGVEGGTKILITLFVNRLSQTTSK